MVDAAIYPFAISRFRPPSSSAARFRRLPSSPDRPLGMPAIGSFAVDQPPAKPGFRY